MGASASPLRERWKTADGVSRLRDAVAALTSGAQLDANIFGTHDGRLDLRGISIPAGGIGGRLDIRERRLERIDFSYATIEDLSLIDAELDDCIFLGTKLEKFRMWGSRLSRCRFERADMRECVLGGISLAGRPCSHEDVQFIRCDLRRMSPNRVTFKRCRFDECRISNVECDDARFIDCSFIGLLDDVRFNNMAQARDAMTNVDFSHARLRYCEFRRYDFDENDQIKWPVDGRHFVVTNYKCILEHVVAGTVRDRGPSGQVHTIAGMQRKWAGPAQSVGVISLWDYSGNPDEAQSVAILRAILTEAIAACGSRLIAGDL